MKAMQDRRIQHPSVTGVTLSLRIWSPGVRAGEGDWEPEHGHEPESEPEPERDAESEPERDAESEPEPERDAESEPEPESKKIRGAVVLVHGLGEHVGRYRHVAEHLVGQGYRVYGMDHAGFGRSGGRRGDTSVQRAARDVASLGERIDQELGPDTPRALLGHSMGGLIALVVLRDQPERFSRAVVIGPALNVARGIHPVLLGLSRLLGHTVKAVTLANGIDVDGLCTDPEVVRSYQADPLVHDRISARLFNSMRAEGERLRREPGCFPPDAALLLMHGREDPICFADDTEAYFESLPLETKSLKLWPGMRHEILNEPEHPEVLDEIDRFL
jgi:alpha-beta hydrolase superfamily lysophospholipase